MNRGSSCSASAENAAYTTNGSGLSLGVQSFLGLALLTFLYLGRTPQMTAATELWQAVRRMLVVDGVTVDDAVMAIVAPKDIRFETGPRSSARIGAAWSDFASVAV